MSVKVKVKVKVPGQPSTTRHSTLMCRAVAGLDAVDRRLNIGRAEHASGVDELTIVLQYEDLTTDATRCLSERDQQVTRMAIVR